MSIEIIGIDHIYIAVSDLNRSERFYDRMMKHCTFEMRYPPMTKHLSSSSFKACCSILGKSVRAPSWWKERATRIWGFQDRSWALAARVYFNVTFTARLRPSPS